MSPVYLQIKNKILKNIHCGLWKSGDFIPGEVQLSIDFGVSRMTVNRAIKELEAERILERKRGSGTIVAQEKFNMTLIEIRNIADDIKSKGSKYHAEVVSKKIINTNEHLAKIFPDCANKTLYEVNIIHYENDKPIQYEQRWVNPILAPDFINQDFSKVNASGWLIEFVPLESGKYVVEALNMPVEISEKLHSKANTPALVLRRYTYSQGNTASHGVLWHPGDTYQFSGTL